MDDRRYGDNRHAAPARALCHFDGDGRQPAGAEHDHHVVLAELEVAEDDFGEPFDALDEHRLALSVHAHDLGVVRHRQLSHRVKTRVRAVAGEHLLQRDAGVAGAEQVDQAAGRYRVRAQAGGPGDGRHLGGFEPVEHGSRCAEPPAGGLVGWLVRSAGRAVWQVLRPFPGDGRWYGPDGQHRRDRLARR